MMKKYKQLLFAFFLYWIFNVSNLNAQNISYTEIIAEEIPPQIKINGEIIKAITWLDKAGLNYLIISEHTKGDFFTANWKSFLYC